MLAYVLFKIASVVVPVMPSGLTYRLASVMGLLGFYLLPRARRGIRSNLRRVFGPEAAQRDIDRAARRAFQVAAKNYADLFRIPKLQFAELEETVKVDGWEHVEAALAEGRGAIVFSAHLGNMELISQVIVARSLRAVVPVEHVKPERLFRLVTAARSSRGLRMIPIDGGALKAIYRALKANEIVGIGADRDIQGTGLVTRFFGEVTTMPDAPAVLALRTGARVLPVHSVRQPDDTFKVKVYPPLNLRQTGNVHEDVRVNTEMIVRILEGFIRSNPDQWVVFEPVWKDGKTATA
ncbi:MAG: lysophospholipid acyltransferase family protein [Chloroflexota bacterium]